MKNLKKAKAYRVQLGIIEDGHEWENSTAVIVVAYDVVGAMKKVRLRKNCFVSQVEIVTRIDKQ